MTPAQIKSFPAQANTYQKSVDTQTNQDSYEKFLGLYNNDNGKFMETDFMSEPGLNKSDRDRFLKLQREENANGDPRVSKAIQTLRGAVPGTLESLGIYKRDAKSPKDYDRFTGALHEAIQSYQETNGKPPNEQQLTKEIFPNLIMQTTDPDKWFGRTNELFRAGVPDEVKAEAEKDAGKPLNDEEVRKTYLRLQFNKLFGASKPSKTQDRVP
jgi:type II secretory pathway pseudopilin PulG